MKLVLPEEVRTTCQHGWNAMLSWKSRQNRSSFLLLFSSFLTSIWCPCWQNLTGSHLAEVRYLLSLSPHITRQNLGSRSCKSTTPLATPQPPYTLFYAYCYFHALWPHGLQHTRVPCSSQSPGACSNSYPLIWWCHTAISSSTKVIQLISGEDNSTRIHFLRSSSFFSTTIIGPIFLKSVSRSVVSNSCNPMDYSSPGSSVHWILWARILEWAPGSLGEGILLTQGSNPDHLHCRKTLYHWATWKLEAGASDRVCYKCEFLGSTLDLVNQGAGGTYCPPY